MTTPTWDIHFGDCVAGMAEHLAPESVDLCVTSIPKKARNGAENGTMGRTNESAGAVLVTPSGVAPNVRSIEMQHQSTSCPECGSSFSPKHPTQRYCSQRCKWTHNNRTRTLKPNVIYDCVVCGKHVERYVSPSAQKNQALRYCSRTCARKALSGDKHHAWNGGISINDQGYVHRYAPDHPHATERGYVREHRLMVEQSLGRYLRPEEVVHHINGDVSDNRLENLQLFANNAEHKAFEDQSRKRGEGGRMLPKGETR